MKANTITIKQSIFINRPREVVWDFTQDFRKRTKWDTAVKKATVLQINPERIVRVKTTALTTMTLVYELEDWPNKTNIVIKDVKSLIMKTGGEGSWSYTNDDLGTLWNQTNTIILRNYVLLPFFIKFYTWLFTFQTKRAMKKAKKIIESL